MQVACADCNPMHHEHPNNDECMVYVHAKGANLTAPCPHSQAKESFPEVLAWHVMRTSGRELASSDPRLAWTVDLWDRMTTSFNPTLPDLNDPNMSSMLRNQVSDKKIKSSHVTAESTVEVRCGHKLDKSRNLQALINAGSPGCIILNEFTVGINHKRSEDPQQWMTKGGVFQTNGICPRRLLLE
jgi:hypothetical protein